MKGGDNMSFGELMFLAILVVSVIIYGTYLFISWIVYLIKDNNDEDEDETKNDYDEESYVNSKVIK